MRKLQDIGFISQVRGWDLLNNFLLLQNRRQMAATKKREYFQAMGGSLGDTANNSWEITL